MPSAVVTGVYKIAALATAVAFAWGGPLLAKDLWPGIVEAFRSPADALGAELDMFMLIAGGLGMNLGVTLIGNLLYGIVYFLHLPFFEQYRSHSEKPWPWRPDADPEARRKFWAMLPGSVGLVLFNNFCVALPALAFIYPIGRYFGAFGIAAGDAFPDPLTVCGHIAFAMVVEDTMFYWVHRTLHHPSVYKYIHKKHHEYQQVIALSSEHAHPLEFLLGNLMPLISGPLILRSHLVSVWLWIIVRITVSVDEHGGYDFPWSPVRLLPFGASAEGHAYHHSHTTGIYASQFAWWDWITGTDAAFHRWRARNAGKAAPPATEGKAAGKAASAASAPGGPVAARKDE